MSDLSNKTAYLKGLAEGMKLAQKSDEGSVISKLIEVMESMAEEIEDISLFCDDIDGELDVIRESVTDIGMSVDELYEMNENIRDFSDEPDDDDLFDPYDDNDDLFEIHCPECGEDVIVDYDMLDEENNIICPNCQHEIELEFDIDDEEDTAQKDQ